MTRRFSAEEYSDAVKTAITSSANGVLKGMGHGDDEENIRIKLQFLAFKAILNNEIDDLWRKRDEG